ncbi:LuxR C-terminal-related transcriptional regulator [Bacillus sp. FJAT-44742]|uniref:LuxR C-terminal-related transcriptional regulator n=1 Tax=Bacillus sp. FJAT-44742 TaxID=2014005 RepID=UPI0012FE906D|nr:LuxR C-terminal-related transcriptional regulator [Bacillus sp. FJAT-44742]
MVQIGKEWSALFDVYYLLLEETDYKWYVPDLAQPFAIEETSNDYIKMKDKKGTLQVIWKFQTLNLINLVNELQTKGATNPHISVMLPVNKAYLLEKLLEQNVTHIFSNLRSGQSVLQVWHEHSSSPSFIDVPFHTHLVSLISSHNEENSFIKKDPFYNLRLKEEELPSYFTESEVVIMHEMVQGKSNQQIAKDVYLSVPTVNGHVSRLLKKLSARNKCHFIKKTLEKGFVKMEKSEGR